MQILAVPYALLLVLSAALCHVLPQAARPALLAVASLAFYALLCGPQALLIVGLLGLVWFLALRLSRRDPRLERQRSAWLGLGIVLCVAVLAYYKYATFAADSLTWLAARLHLPWRAIPTPPSLSAAVPLGISFFTFEFIHFLADAKRRQITLLAPSAPAGQRWLEFSRFAAFALFFPTLLAGPIKRYQKFAEKPRVDATDVAYGLGRIVLGLVKKLAIADSVAPIALRLLVPDQATPLGLWLAMYAYAAQIYFDFSGYSDLAIGAARLLGYRVPENFDWPYLATDLPSFWRRWHISLSSWIRDYLYIPLGGNRGSRWRVAFNLVLVMSLCGLWHGPAWHFVLWGAWHGLGLAATRLWQSRNRESAANKSQPSRPWRIVTTLTTFHFVCFGWLWFATPSASVALTCLARMFHVAP